MNYAGLNDTIIDQVMEAVRLINNPEVEPRVRQLNQEILFREVGVAVYNQVYDMNAFDFAIEYTRGTGIDDRYYGLAKVASGSVSAGNVGLQEYVRNFLDYAATKAQSDAVVNAAQSGEFPKVTRRMNGKETCDWCKGKQGVYTGDNIPPEVYHRHGGCDCSITTEGFKTRNGELKNYVKPKDR